MSRELSEFLFPSDGDRVKKILEILVATFSSRNRGQVLSVVKLRQELIGNSGINTSRVRQKCQPSVESSSNFLMER